MSEANAKMQAKILAILSSLDDASIAPNENRRNKSRMPFRHDIAIVSLGGTDEEKFTIHTRNISTSGVGFLSRRPFEKGERFVLPIRIAGAKDKVVLCRVTFSRYISAGLYGVGAEFEKSAANPSADLVIPADWKAQAMVHAT